MKEHKHSYRVVPATRSWFRYMLVFECKECYHPCFKNKNTLHFEMTGRTV